MTHLVNRDDLIARCSSAGLMGVVRYIRHAALESLVWLHVLAQNDQLHEIEHFDEQCRGDLEVDPPHHRTIFSP